MHIKSKQVFLGVFPEWQEEDIESDCLSVSLSHE